MMPIDSDNEARRLRRARRRKMAETSLSTRRLRPVGLDSRRVLVVDDSNAMRSAIRARLEAMGHQVTVAESGEEAFALCMKRRFDLLISDVTMGAVSGVHLCRMLRAEPTTKDLPIVLLTADDGPRSRFWGRHAGCDAYVSKREPDTLGSAVGTALQARSGTTEPIKSPRPIDPLERLSSVLDAHLLQAVVASEARSLMQHVGDRAKLLEAAVQLFDDVLSCPYAVLEVEPKGGSRRGVAALLRGPIADQVGPEERAALGIEHTATMDAVRQTGPVGPIECGTAETCAVLAGRELVGQLRLYGGPRGLGRDDAETAVWLAAALGPALKSLLLVEETQRLATTDALTGLMNRRTIDAALAVELQRASRYGSPFSVILCDVDRFKQINDTHGHPMGDRVLCALSRRLQAGLREVDAVGRWGGEEFLLILPETDREGAVIVADRLCASIRQMPAFKDGPKQVTMSAGVASFTLGATHDLLLRQADLALYEAKRGGRDRACVAA